MKIKIIKNEGIYNDQNVVSFSSAFGCGKASWNGETPIEGREYYVELEIRDAVAWRKDVNKSDKSNTVLK